MGLLSNLGALKRALSGEKKAFTLSSSGGQRITAAGAAFNKLALKLAARAVGATKLSPARFTVDLQPEYLNAKDPNAIEVTYEGMCLGYVPRDETEYVRSALPPEQRMKRWKLSVPARIHWWDEKRLWILDLYI